MRKKSDSQFTFGLFAFDFASVASWLVWLSILWHDNSIFELKDFNANTRCEPYEDALIKLRDASLNETVSNNKLIVGLIAKLFMQINS